MNYSQMRFPNFRKKAVTLSYDDGVKFDKRLMEIMDKYGDMMDFCQLQLNYFDWTVQKAICISIRSSNRKKMRKYSILLTEFR